ncbi:unnamed protein product [Phytophthora fragariaefolia]|uniref:Unnamed protein product n=1 Tax=Phytophthora fragariaefolia TaxID=1490495 RepID=A0A9W7D2V8_9STRA|nr:unnamed protein product [Phytophthora fragariaefolia]
MSTPTTRTAGAPLVIILLFPSPQAAAPAAADSVVAPAATTRGSSASTSVVTSTVTTSSSPKRTMSLGEYKKARDNTVFARDELEALSVMPTWMMVKKTRNPVFKTRWSKCGITSSS